MKKALLLAFCSLVSCKVADEFNCITGTPCVLPLVCSPMKESCVPMSEVPGSLTVTGVTPASGLQNASTPITITGTGFATPMVVQIGGVMATNVMVKSPTELTALTPPSPGLCGAVNVSVTAVDSTTANKPASFRYTQTGKFGAPIATTFPSAASADQLIVDDVDGDNYADIVIKTPQTLSVCFNNQNGAFNCSFSTTYTFESNFMLLVDYNHDSKKSIMLIPNHSMNTVGLVFKNAVNPSTSFTAQMPILFGVTNINDAIPVKRVARSVTELWLATDGGVYALAFGLNAGTPTSTPPQVAAASLSSLQLTRPETDTLGPQLVGTKTTGGVAVLERNTNGVMFTAADFTPLAIKLLRVADLNGDGRSDLIGATDHGAAFYSALGQEGGSYTTPVAQQATASSVAFEIADLTCSGNPGLVFVSLSKAISYLTGHSDGSFSDPTPILPAGNAISLFAVKDVNNDGRPDLVYLTEAGSLTVAINAVP